VRHAFLDHHSTIESPIHHLDARAKIIVFFTFILLGVSSRPNAFLFFGILVSSLIGITLFAHLPLGHLVRKVLVIVPFLFFVALSIPFLKKDTVGGYNLGLGGLSLSKSGLWILWNVIVKSTLGVFAIILLYSTTPFPKLIKGMERLRFPRIFTMIFSFMYRYSFILIDEMQRMKRARDARCFGGRWLWQSKTIGHLVGTLFLRSFYRGERVYSAMLSRGYHGIMPETMAGRWGWREGLFLSFAPILLILRIYLE